MSMKVKLLRKLTRRPYGLAKFRVGKTWYSKMVRFDKDTTTWFGGIYQFNKNMITIEKGVGNRKVYDQKDWVQYEEGFPIIMFDVNNPIPLNPTAQDLPGMPTAQAIQSSLKKEIAAFEAELMRKQRSKLFQIMIIVLLMSMVTFGISYWAVTKVDAVTKLVEAMGGNIDAIKAAVISAPVPVKP